MQCLDLHFTVLLLETKMRHLCGETNGGLIFVRRKMFLNERGILSFMDMLNTNKSFRNIRLANIDNVPCDCDYVDKLRNKGGLIFLRGFMFVYM